MGDIERAAHQLSALSDMVSRMTDYTDPEVQQGTTTAITAIAQKYRPVHQVTYQQDSRGITFAYLELAGNAPSADDIASLQQQLLERFDSKELQVVIAPMPIGEQEQQPGILAEPEELPEHLYHYTDVGGLFGILSSKVLWATHIAFLNDTREVHYGADEAVKHIDTIWETIREKAQSQPNYEGLQAIFERLRTLPDLIEPMVHRLAGMYVTCLSREGDLLSQWRGYGGSGGYSIQFDAQQLRNTLQRVPPKPPGSTQQFSVAITKVEYDNDKFHPALNGVIKAMADKLSNPELPKIPGAAPQIITQTTSEILGLSMRLKDPAFREEQEYRITTAVQTFPVNDAADACHYYPGKLGLIPRVHLAYVPSSIKKIIVGPGDFAATRKASLEHFISTHRDYAGVTVELSKIPFRSMS